LGAPVAGSGSPLLFGLQTLSGSYTVVATDATFGCAINMFGSVSVGTYPLLSVYNVTASATSFCAGGSGVDIKLSGSTIAIKYYLYNAGTLIDSFDRDRRNLGLWFQKLCPVRTRRCW